MAKTATVFETNKIKNILWPKKSPVYIVARFGVYSKLLGIQIGPFRVNLHWDSWNKLPNTFGRLYG